MIAVTCPECGAAAEITERFTLASTDGPVAHVALSCAGGHHYRMAADKLPARPFRPRVILGPRRRPHTFPLCVRCRVNPAGFWVSGKDTSVVRRPWGLSCCDDLDRELCDMTPFGGQPRTIDTPSQAHALHQAIARATHNTRLVDLSARIRREVGLGFDAEPYTPEMRRRALRQHPTLAGAIIAGDPGRAARLAANHFSLTDTTLTDLRARLHLRSGGDTDARSQG